VTDATIGAVTFSASSALRWLVPQDDWATFVVIVFAACVVLLVVAGVVSWRVTRDDDRPS
jgi:hypothetical protein